MREFWSLLLYATSEPAFREHERRIHMLCFRWDYLMLLGVMVLCGLAILVPVVMAQLAVSVHDNNGAIAPDENRDLMSMAINHVDTRSHRQTHIGDALPGTDPQAFKEAKNTFGEIENIHDGLGPTFNERGCGSCHTTPVIGGSGEQIERRFGRVEDGVFLAFDTDEDNQGGTLRQLFSVGTYHNGSMECTIPVETTPSNANVRNVGRRTQPLFGLGLVDAMPDAFFDRLADAQPASVRGIVNRVPVVLPDPRDPSQRIGSMRVGRFGWKGLIPSLLVFSGDAYDNEMGITTQSCFDGVSILEFAEENFPNNVPPPEGCNGGDLAPSQPDHPDLPAFNDDAVGPCNGGRTEIQDDLVLFTTFMELLAPPSRDFSDPKSIRRGKPLFTQIGCAHCHVTTTFVTPRRPFNGVPGNFAFNPYSDFLVHDMGSLGDRIGETGDSKPQTRLMRTQPLWGARFNKRFLHDGRAGNIQEAIQAHDGQGAAARDAFNALDRADQHALIQFVRSL
jgi:CxxC motif-containing protein (DUF1111 family)